MSVINLEAPVITQTEDVYLLQKRFEQPIRALIATPWGNGVLVTGITLAKSAGNQSLTVRHGLGRKVTGAVLWNCNVPIYGPWGLTAIDTNSCTVSVNLPSAITTGSGSLDIWIG